MGRLLSSRPSLAISSSLPRVSSSPKPSSRATIIPTPFSSLLLFLPLPIHSPRPISVAASKILLPRATWQKPQYVYPDPIPEFAAAETEKFRDEFRKKLSKDKEIFGNDIDDVVKVCVEIFSDFLHKEYEGPGTLLVEPFTDMLLALKEKKLPGAPVAARAALLWAQNYVDKDWEMWTSQLPQ